MRQGEAPVYNVVRLTFDCYAAGMAATMLVSLPAQAHFAATRQEQPARLLGFLPLPRLPHALFNVLGVVLAAALLLAAAGIAARWLIAVALISYLLYFGQIIQLSFVGRKTNLAPISLAVFLMAPGLTAPVSVPVPVWPVIAAQVVVACVYLSAGLAKLRRSGPGWITGRPFQAYLADNYLWRDSAVTWLVARSRPLCASLSSFAIGTELCFPAALISPYAAVPLVAAAIAMHAGAHILMGINYLRYWWLNYLPFIVPAAIFFARLIRSPSLGAL